MWIITLALASVAEAPDLNTPIDTGPTVGSEINRGNKAAFDCSLQNVSDVLSFSQCVSDAISADEQKQPNSLPFMVGAYWGECGQEALMVKTDRELAATNSIAAESLLDAERELAMCYPVFRNYQKKLGITDQQVVAAIDDLTPAGREELLSQLHAWERQPPNAGAPSEDVAAPPQSDATNLQTFEAASVAGAAAAAKQGGLGVTFITTAAGIVLIAVAPQSTAATAGLKAGQVIQSVNGIDLKGMSQPAVLAVMKGLGREIDFNVVGVGVVKVMRP